MMYNQKVYNMENSIVEASEFLKFYDNEVGLNIPNDLKPRLANLMVAYGNKISTEEEIQARIEFKMMELLKGVENQALNCWNASMSGNHPKYSYYAQAFNQLKQMLMKEMIMSPPCDNMAELKKRESRDKAISKIMKRFCKEGEREYGHKERFLVDVIHNLQNDK